MKVAQKASTTALASLVLETGIVAASKSRIWQIRARAHNCR
jgi:hypothetical protein